jgi:histidinol-phosphate aminotransferase
MAGFEDLIPEHIRALSAYSPGKTVRLAQRETGLDSIIKLASNENSYGPSPKAVAAMREAAAASSVYPDNEDSELRAKLAELHKVTPEQILVTGGSTQFLDIIAGTLLAPGVNAVTGNETFIVYPIVVRASGGALVEAPMRRHAFDLDAILHAINSKTRLVLLANPNNPTGTIFDAAAFDRFFAKVPQHVLVVLDEAYCDYATAFAKHRGIEYSHSLDYVREGRNLIVLRTFSKAHGLAGIRVGYGLGPPSLLQHFARVRPAFAVSGVAQAAALAAMDDHAHVQHSVQSNLEQSKWVLDRLAELGVKAIPTFGNFICFDAGEDAAAFAQRLQANGIIARPLGLWGMTTSIRVTIGTPEENKRFITALQGAMERAAAR